MLLTRHALDVMSMIWKLGSATVADVKAGLADNGSTALVRVLDKVYRGSSVLLVGGACAHVTTLTCAAVDMDCGAVARGCDSGSVVDAYRRECGCDRDHP